MVDTYTEQYGKIPIEVRLRHDLSEKTLASLSSLWIEAGLPPPLDISLAELGYCAQWLARAFDLDAELLVRRLADTILRSLTSDEGVQ